MAALQPTGLMVNLLRYPERTTIRTRVPRFSWIVNADTPNAVQHGSQILVSTNHADLARDIGDVWDSGVPDIRGAWTTDSSSIAVSYGGVALQSQTSYYWKVRTWLSAHDVGPWSEVQRFRTGQLTDEFLAEAYLPDVEVVPPATFVQRAPGSYFIDFGRAAFGTIAIESNADAETEIVVHLGEVRSGAYAIDRAPGG
ncbi:MAG: hypothetical protein EA382_17980, partial [Spirochaetaceae bacterium]